MPNRVIDTPQAISLADYDPSDTEGMTQDDAHRRMQPLEQRLGELQELLQGAKTHSLLILLQGMGAAGKDPTIEQVLTAFDPDGCHVWPFKKPTPNQAAHDFLWRAHQHTPERGMVAIFDRSYYGDVLGGRVYGSLSPVALEQHYAQINDFERMLVQDGTVLLKFFVHISKEKELQRLLEREKNPADQWKLSPNDWHDREHWDAFARAYEDALEHCSTPYAPWIIVPSDDPGYRNYFIARAIVDRLNPFAEAWQHERTQRGAQKLRQLDAAHIPEREEHRQSGQAQHDARANPQHDANGPHDAHAPGATAASGAQR